MNSKCHSLSRIHIRFLFLSFCVCHNLDDAAFDHSGILVKIIENHFSYMIYIVIKRTDYCSNSFYYIMNITSIQFLVLLLTIFQRGISHQFNCQYSEQLDIVNSGNESSYFDSVEFRRYDSRWPDGKVKWAFISDGSDKDLNKKAFYIDRKAGFNRAEYQAILESIRRIEQGTCMKFQRVKPREPRGFFWIGRAKKNGKCHKNYINNVLQKKKIGSLGYIFKHWDANCVWGGYAMGSSFVHIGGNDPSDETYKGVITHEILHILGIGHTHTRQGIEKKLTCLILIFIEIKIGTNT